MLLLALLVGLALWHYLGCTERRTPSLASTAAVFAVTLGGTISTALSERPVVGAVECGLLILLLLVAIQGRCTDAKELTIAGAAFAAIVAACYSVGVVANMASAYMVHMPIGRDTFLVGFSNPRFPAQLQALTLPLMPLALTAVRHRGARLGLGFAFALWWMCLIGSGSRTAWLAMATAAAAMVLLGATGRRWLAIQAPFAAAGALVYGLIFFVIAPGTGVETVVESGRLQDAASIAARFDLARLALGMVASSPLAGVGPMHFAYVDNGLGAHPHNFVLQLAAEWGVLVALTFVVMIGTLFVRAWRTARRYSTDTNKGLLAACLLAALTAWVVGIQFDGYMVLPTSQIASMVVLMLCVALLSLEMSPVALGQVPHSHLRRAGGWITTTAAVVASFTLIAMPLAPFGSPTERELQWRAENPSAPLWPRFWQQGWIGPDSDPTAR